LVNVSERQLLSALVLNFMVNANLYYNYLLTIKLSAMKNLLLTLCFVFITSFIFCQTPNAQNTRVHLKYYIQNCVSLGSINDIKKINSNETEISPNKSPIQVATSYNRMTDYSMVCSIGQNTWHKSASVVKPWQCLNGSLLGLGFRGGYSVATVVNGKISLLDGKLSL
jgi:hypothetical protein